MSKSMDNSIKITLIISAVIVFLALLGVLTLNSLNPSPSDTVSVTGESTIEVSPDVIGVYFNIQTTGVTSQEAKDENFEIYNDLVANLVAKDIPETEAKTQYFNIYPDYKWTDEGREENGFRATQGIQIKFNLTDLDKITDVLDAGVNAGAGVSNINFELSEELESSNKAKAIEQSAKEARTKAEAVATGFGKSVGKLVSTSVDDYNYRPWPLYEARADVAVEETGTLAKQAVTNIQPSDRTVSARVTAVFKLV